MKICDECGASISRGNRLPQLGDRLLCSDCCSKAFIKYEQEQLARCRGLCDRCGATLHQGNMLFPKTREVICSDCYRRERVENWDKLKKPGVPENCEHCGRSLVGHDIAMLWKEEALCGLCFDEIKKEHPEITEFKAIVLVDLSWADDGDENGADSTEEEEAIDADGIPHHPYIN